MIGNDIVDLQVSKRDNNWRRPRYLQKIFSLQEQSLIENATDKDIAVWLLWSRKESAYKIISRFQRRRFFEPKKFKNTTLNLDLGKSSVTQSIGAVNYGKYSLITKSKITDKYIHTIAQLQKSSAPLLVNNFYIDKIDYTSQHQKTKQQLFESYAVLTNCSVKNLNIKKSASKVPHLYLENRKQMVTISTSHHGNYGGIALQSMLKYGF